MIPVSVGEVVKLGKRWNHDFDVDVCSGSHVAVFLEVYIRQDATALTTNN